MKRQKALSEMPPPRRTEPRRGARRQRHGYSLVFFAMLLFGLMAMAALVLDLGLARLAQTQMQSAVNSASLEGLRYRDAESLQDARRQAAKRVRWYFDDNLGEDQEDAFNYGAGPDVTFSGGVGDPSLKGGQLITIDDSPVYKPSLQLNEANLAHGDMVWGDFKQDEAAGESSDYVRQDFNPTVGTGNAFLVRLRRTNDFQGLDSVSGVSSRGGPIPYLFGLGSLLRPADPTTQFSPRHHGITVRATAIAEARPALSVGIGTSEFDGVVPVAIAYLQWNEYPLETPQPLESSEAYLFDLTAEQPLVVGSLLPESGDSARSAKGYLPLVVHRSQLGNNASDEWVVAGFGYAEFSVSGANWTLTRYPSRVAKINASAAFLDHPDVEGDELNQVMSILLNDVSEPLLAPAIVRHR